MKSMKGDNAINKLTTASVHTIKLLGNGSQGTVFLGHITELNQ